MKLSVSNIAWKAEEDADVYSLMRLNGFLGLEIAPARVWVNSVQSEEEQEESFHNNLRKFGIQVASLQALHYGYPELQLFKSAESRRALLEYTKKCIRLAQRLGAGVLVFGSPRNRRADGIPVQTVEKISLAFFAELAEYAEQYGTAVCIEANPVDYGCDFITRTADAVEFVKLLDMPGLRVNIDTGTILLNEEDPIAVLSLAIPYAGHCHLSAPHLTPLSNENFYGGVIKTLKEQFYNGWISIEMKSNPEGENISSIERAIRVVRSLSGELSDG